jgi:DNA-binding MarR family transcriptional regulator
VETDTNLTDAELAARLRLVIMRLARKLRQQAPAGVTPSQLSALSTLSEKGALTLGMLAEAERVRPPTMTRIVAALEEDGLIARSHDPGDRRRVNILMTEMGKRLISSNRSRKTAYLVDRLRDLPAKDRAMLQRAEEVLEKILEDRD